MGRVAHLDVVLNRILGWVNNDGKRKRIFSFVYIFYCSIKSLNPYEWICVIHNVHFPSENGYTQQSIISKLFMIQCTKYDIEAAIYAH